MERVITVDGLAGSGKTTISRALAARLGWGHFNSGSLYRTVGLLAVRSQIDPDDEGRVAEELGRHELAVQVTPQAGTVIQLNGVVLSEDLTTAVISDATSRSSRHPSIRTALLAVQRKIAEESPLVAEGRDMGTIIFPDAPLKFFVTASEDVRAERRLKQWRETGARSEVELKQQLVKEIRERDERDMLRAVAPTTPAHDSLPIDNSGPTLTQVVESMYALARSRGLADT
jgi:cytidylate kinase